MSIDYCVSRANEIPYKRGEQRHWCAIYDKRGRLLSEASNSYIKTSPKMKRAGQKVGLDEKIYWHAECKAIYSLRNPEKAYKLVVVRVGSKGEPVNSKPCIICERLIKLSGIRAVEYTI